MTVGPPHNVQPYMTVALDKAIAEVRSRGVDILDFGVGDPRAETPEFIRTAVKEAIRSVSSYPKAAGLPELRASIAAWIGRRFSASLDPDRQVLPTLGSKEIIHSLAAYVLSEERNVVLVPSPAYPVYERGARFHGAEVHTLPLREGNGFLPDLDAVPESILERTALAWINYPNNPTTALASRSFYEAVAEKARRHNFVLASDEAYSELWFDQPAASVLELEDLQNVVAINTLSKRSCMTGYRSGFLAGDPHIVSRLTGYRASVGVTPQEFIQRASVVAWDDDSHAEDLRQHWAQKRELMLPVFTKAGLTVHADATFFLWIRVPEPHTSAGFAAALLQEGVATSPGHYFGEEGEGFVRMALVPPLDQCEDAAQRLSNLLPTICETE